MKKLTLVFVVLILFSCQEDFIVLEKEEPLMEQQEVFAESISMNDSKIYNRVIKSIQSGVKMDFINDVGNQIFHIPILKKEEKINLNIGDFYTSNKKNSKTAAIIDTEIRSFYINYIDSSNNLKTEFYGFESEKTKNLFLQENFNSLENDKQKSNKFIPTTLELKNIIIITRLIPTSKEEIEFLNEKKYTHNNSNCTIAINKNKTEIRRKKVNTLKMFLGSRYSNWYPSYHNTLISIASVATPSYSVSFSNLPRLTFYIIRDHQYNNQLYWSGDQLLDFEHFISERYKSYKNGSTVYSYLSSNTWGDARGRAFLGGNINISYIGHQQALPHEFGHNFGAVHYDSSTWDSDLFWYGNSVMTIGLGGGPWYGVHTYKFYSHTNRAVVKSSLYN
ncbi:zinc-dependent metalloprotease [Polaribacter sp.]|nr:zinc-dependent metalloprotease [Polaribacter sp.]